MYTWLRERNESAFIQQVKERNGIGGIAKLDITKVFNKFLFSFFADYQIQTFSAGSSAENVRVNISGLYLGLSIGYRF